MVTVKNRDLGELRVQSVVYSPFEDAHLIAFTSETGQLIASLMGDSLIITDPAYPKLRYNAERFRPLLMEALSLWQAESTA